MENEAGGGGIGEARGQCTCFTPLRMRCGIARAIFASLALGASSASGACSTTLDHPPYASQSESALVEVTTPPPPGRVEVVAPRPNPAAVWVDGEWAWRRRRWAWLPGRWVDVPRGAKFSPWAFVRGTDGRFWYAPGSWRDANGADAGAPLALAEARADSSEVVNASGIAESTGATIKAQLDAAAPPSAHQ